MPTEKQINDELIKLQKSSREGLMKLNGVDVPKLRAFEKDIFKKYSDQPTLFQRISVLWILVNQNSILSWEGDRFVPMAGSRYHESAPSLRDLVT